MRIARAGEHGRIAALVLLAAWWAPAAVHAQQSVVIYRCTNASGALTIQNDTPCPKGSKQERRVMEASPAGVRPPPTIRSAPPSAPVAPEAAPAPATRKAEPESTAATAVAAEDRLPPPVLFECRTFDNGRYLSENGNPPPRCIALGTTGLGGMVGTWSGTACEMKQDRCQRLSDAALCDGWRQRLREAESALQFGVVENREQAEADFERFGRVVRDSTCGS